MRVFKFGGASVKNAAALRNVASILSSQKDPLLVVVSAMGKTTNTLELIASASEKQTLSREINILRSYHHEIIDLLFDKADGVQPTLEKLFNQIQVEANKKGDYDQKYDQVVSLGEVISSVILSNFLTQEGIENEWIDARHYIFTDNTFREGKVDWDKTQRQIQQLLPILNNKIIITQGFIGATENNLTTTLGREGSDFTAAIFGACLDAESVTIWKDVPGVMNADPKRLSAAIVFEELPFQEAAEMTYYGASVIHPKTIKPLANRDIPLFVKSFADPSADGTKIHDCKIDHLPPLIVFKENQCLISCKVTDYTFIDEHHLGIIFHALSEKNIKVNVMQTSAISFSFCVDFREDKITSLVKMLGEKFEVFYNTGLTLITVKNYDQKTFDEYRLRHEVVLEQSSRSTLQVLIKR
ncbi:MAG: aspartate kinase [Bacteroidia bacterium]|nr:aspartate kinase [Bacteroidia bacterium]